MKILIAVSVLLATAYGAYKMNKEPRGIRNNNAGNIRHSSAKWNGMTTNQTDSAFVQFRHAKYGIRALAKLIHNYQKKYGINTIHGLVSRYAPSIENDTSSYAKSVARRTGISVNAPIVFDHVMHELIDAIIHHENGKQPYSTALIDEGITLAGIAKV